MTLRSHARHLREQKRRELEALYPALRAKPRPLAAPPVVSLPAPTRDRGQRIVIGRDRNGLVFSLSDESRFLHTHMIGVPKSGKSNAMIHGVRQDARNGAAVILLDPHGNHEDSVYNRTVQWLSTTADVVRRKVHLVDPGSAWSCGFNPLHCPDDTDPSVIAGNMLEAVERGFNDEDSQQRPTMRRGLRALFIALAELNLTLTEAPYFLLPDDQFNARAWALQELKDERARAYFERLTRLATNPRMSQTFDVETVGILNRLEEFTSSAAIRRIFGQQEGIDLRAIMDEGGVVLVNCAGGTNIYEKEGDLLGRLFLRSVLFNAKRRTNKRPTFMWLDEGHRFVSGDVPILFEEVRKNSVGICIGHQDLSQLGEPGDRIREAILAVPQNRLVFRLNSVAEAGVLAPEVVKLNLELPVGALTQPTVVGYDIRHMRTQSTGGGTTATNSHSQTVTATKTESAGTSVGGSSETSKSIADTEGVTHSNSVTRGTADTVSQSTTRSRSTTVTESESETEMSSSGSSSSTGESTGTGTTKAYGYDSPSLIGPNVRPDHYTASTGTTSTRSVGDSSTASEGTSTSRGSSIAETVGEAETEGTAHTVSESTTEGIAHTKSRTIGTGESEGRNWAKTQQHGTSVGVGNTAGSSTGTSDTWSTGFTESLVPIMEDRTGAVHSKENVVHMAAEVINNLPTGTAIVKALVGGKIESALVALPYIDDPRERVEGAAKAHLLSATPNALPGSEVDKIIAARREWLRAKGATVIAELRKSLPEPVEPKTFRVPAPKTAMRR